MTSNSQECVALVGGSIGQDSTKSLSFYTDGPHSDQTSDMSYLAGSGVQPNNPGATPAE